MNYQDINAQTIDHWVESGWIWGIPIDHETYARAALGDWQVHLTPTKSVPRAWLGELNGRRVLGLACGGGQQMPILTAAGAACTVLDYSEKQLESERMVAAREGYAIEIIRADMSKPLPFADVSFDLVFHPVSNCYIEQVEPVWRECYRILKPGGRLLAGLDNGMNFLVDEQDESRIRNSLPFNPLKNEAQRRMLEATDSGMQFSHTLDEQIGGQLRAGFRLIDVYEDTNGAGFLHDMHVPCFWASCAEKPCDRIPCSNRQN